MAIICHCEAVREHTIVDAVASGAHDLDAVRTICGAASQCGGCTEAVEELVSRHGPGRHGAPVGLPRVFAHAG